MTLSSCWSTTDLSHFMIVSKRSWGSGGREEGKENGKEGGSGCSNTVLLVFCKSLIVSCILVVH